MTSQFGSRGDGRWAVTVDRYVAHPLDRVWAAVTEPDGLSAWFPCTATFELRVGGAARFEFGGDGVVTALDPPRLLGFTWGDEELRFELEADGAGTRFRLVHAFDDREGAASLAAGWTSCLDALAERLDGHPVPEFDRAAVVALHERLVAEFGLAAPVAEPVPDGWRVRLERQLTEPAGTVSSRLPSGVDGERWELGTGVSGAGMGARLLVTWTGADPAARDAVLARLPGEVARLAATLAPS